MLRKRDWVQGDRCKKRIRASVLGRETVHVCLKQGIKAERDEKEIRSLEVRGGCAL